MANKEMRRKRYILSGPLGGEGYIMGEESSMCPEFSRGSEKRNFNQIGLIMQFRGVVVVNLLTPGL